MRLHWKAVIAASTLLEVGSAFAPLSLQCRSATNVAPLDSTAADAESAVETMVQTETEVDVFSEIATSDEMDIDIADIFPMAEREEVTPLTAEEINSRLSQQLEKMRQKDQSSLLLTKEDLKVVFEDKHMMVVDKPSGVLTVAGKVDNPNLAQSVFDAFGADLPSADHMVVHRLGMDTSGVIVFAKNKAAVRGMNGEFRERKVERTYEALVAGHMKKDEGLINLPIMRDYEFPPYVRISTDDHQRALIDLTAEEVGKKLLEGPKASLTKYQVVSREEFEGLPVTRVTLTSISGRYHQLNVHMAAFGHPIVGDKIYGYKGEAVTNGGLTREELETLAPNPNRADDELLAALADAAKDRPPCVHAKFIRFQHPVKERKTVEFRTDAPF